MLDRDLLTELQLTLIEPPDGGDTWPSLVWSRDEVLDALNAGVRALARDAHLDVARVEIPVGAGALSVPLPADWLATASLVWRSALPPAPSTLYQATVLADGAIAYWPLDETSGGTARDLVGTRHGTITGGVLLAVAGATPGTLAMAFNGTGRIDMATSPPLIPAFSQEVWFWTTVLPSINQILYGRDRFFDLSSTLDALGFGRLRMTVWSQPFAGVYAPVGMEFTTGVWHHAVATHDGTTLRLYQDAVLLQEAASFLIPDYFPLLSTIGNEVRGSDNGWVGRISDVALYPTALTPTQIAAHYAERLTPSDVVPIVPPPVRTPLGPVDSFEGDLAVPGWETARGLPLGYADLDQSTLTLRLVPTPLAEGTIELLYIRVPPAVSGAQPGTELPLADEFLAGVKYAALATLLRKVGRLIDPERAAYCDRRYQLTHTAASIILDGWS